MKTIILLAGVWVGIIGISSAQADIYTWVDESGIRHFSNHLPQSGAKIFLETDAFTNTRATIKNRPSEPSYSPDTPPTTNSDFSQEYTNPEGRDLADTNRVDTSPIDTNPAEQSQVDRVSNLQKKLEETLKQVEGLEKKLHEINDPVDTPHEAHVENGLVRRDDRKYHHHYRNQWHHYGHKKRPFITHYPKNNHNPYFSKHHKTPGRRYGQYEQKERTPNKKRHFQSTSNRSRRYGVYSTRSQIRKNRQAHAFKIKNRPIGIDRQRHR